MARCRRRPSRSAGGAPVPIPLTASGRKKSCRCSRGEAAGRLRATTIIEWLEEKFPGRFSASQLRTLQRRLQDWRALNGPDQEVYFPQEHPPGREAQLDFTHCNSLGVTIGGRRYRHLLFQLVLSHSGWRYAEVVAGETFVSLKQGLQNALWELGGAPQVIRSDNTSALTHEIKRSRGRALNDAYGELLDHYGLRSTLINSGESHENGVAEQAHFISAPLVCFVDALDTAATGLLQKRSRNRMPSGGLTAKSIGSTSVTVRGMSSFGSLMDPQASIYAPTRTTRRGTTC